MQNSSRPPTLIARTSAEGILSRASYNLMMSAGADRQSTTVGARRCCSHAADLEAFQRSEVFGGSPLAKAKVCQREPTSGIVHGGSRFTDDRWSKVALMVLASVRRCLPTAEIILSNGMGERCRLDAIGCCSMRIQGGSAQRWSFRTLHQPNAACFTSRLASDANVCDKLDTDCSCCSADFNEVSTDHAIEVSLLEQPVHALNLFTRHPLRLPVLFHLSDLFHAGLLRDLRTLWNVPLVEEPGFTRALEGKPQPKINAFPGHDIYLRCSPEQYLMEQLARRKEPQLRIAHGRWRGGDVFTWLRLLA